MKMFEGKVALVTGASSGIGKATALKFAEEGASVVIAARRKEQSTRVLEEITALGAEAHFVQTDVSRASDVENMVASAIERFGRLDCAVNNAGMAGPRLTPAADITEAQWDEVMGVNLKGVWLSMKYEIPAMLESGGGAIVNVSSIYGIKPSDMGHAAYSTSKHGVVGLTQSVAADYGQMAIRANVVAPGFTRTEMVDPDNNPDTRERYEILLSRHSGMKRLGQAEETANAITWLCAEASSYVNGVVLAVDGGGATRIY